MAAIKRIMAWIITDASDFNNLKSKAEIIGKTTKITNGT